MSLPSAVNNTPGSAYFYTKSEIDGAVATAISTIAGSVSTGGLFTNLTVSSIVVNPSGSIATPSTISTTTLRANTFVGNSLQFSTLLAQNANIGNIIAPQISTTNIQAFNASVSSMTVSSINGSLFTQQGQTALYNLTGLIPTTLVGSNMPYTGSTLTTGFGAGSYAVNVVFSATSVSTPTASFMASLQNQSPLVSIIDPLTTASNAVPLTFANSAVINSINGNIQFDYALFGTGSAAFLAPSTLVSITKVV